MREPKKIQVKFSRKNVLLISTGIVVFLALVAVVSKFVLKPIEVERWGDTPFAEVIADENIKAIENKTAIDNAKKLYDEDVSGIEPAE
jgi:hypothetical protein